MMTAHGRLAGVPTLKPLPGGNAVCEFRLLATRFAKGQEHTEAVTFFCFGEEAERFCQTVEMGQLIYATGTQETQQYTDAGGQKKQFIKYKLTWWLPGARPKGSRQESGQSGNYAPQQPVQQYRQPRQEPVQNNVTRPPQMPVHANAPAPEFDDVTK